MADEVSIEELRADLEAVLRRVAGGERLTITIDGVAFAELKPPPPQKWVPKERYLPMLENRPVDPEFFEMLREVQGEDGDEQGERLKRFYGDE
jgi:antitoxin (DNA-binding transcriptional repressor) of toxin-antitoxin stability system